MIRPSSAMRATLLIAIFNVLLFPSESKFLSSLDIRKGEHSAEEDMQTKTNAGSTEDVLGPPWVNFSDPNLLWTNPKDLPYFIDPSLGSYSHIIKEAIYEFENVSCLRFSHLIDLPLSDEDYLHFISTKDHGCASYIGRQGGGQEISFETEVCTQKKGTAMHLIFLALGFGQEHNRPDRDEYIDITWDNVIDTKKNYLIKYNGSVADYAFGEDYDYYSLLHGHKNLYSINSNSQTITPINEVVPYLGQRYNFSNADIRRLNAKYCTETSTSTTELTTREIEETTAATQPTTGIALTGCNQPTCNGSFHPNMPDPEDCTKYYVCEPNNKLTRMDCPAGLFYNPSIWVCDWPNVVNTSTLCCNIPTRNIAKNKIAKLNTVT